MTESWDPGQFGPRDPGPGPGGGPGPGSGPGPGGSRRGPEPGGTIHKKPRVSLPNTGGFLVSTPTVRRPGGLPSIHTYVCKDLTNMGNISILMFARTLQT